MTYYTPSELLRHDATSTDVHRNGSKLNIGAHIYIAVGQKREPVTIIADNGVAYEYVKGHVTIDISTNRSLLYLYDHVEHG